MKFSMIFILSVVLVSFSGLMLANESTSQTDNTQVETQESPSATKLDPSGRLSQAARDFTFEDFPTLHPVVVHVPVIMIPVASLFGLMSIFFASRSFVMLATAFALAGLAGGYIAAYPMHPHTHGLPEAAAATLQQHDFFAYSTLVVTAIAVVIGVAAMLMSNLFTRVLLAVTLLIASLCVSVTAHYGGTLTYVHGVGVQGKFLDEH